MHLRINLQSYNQKISCKSSENLKKNNGDGSEVPQNNLYSNIRANELVCEFSLLN